MKRLTNVLVILQFIALSLLLVSFGMSNPTLQDKQLLDMKYSPSDAFEENKKDPLIKLHDSDGNFFCTGFVIDKHYALTAGHCIDGRFGLTWDDITVKDMEGAETGVIAKAAGINRRLDWGILRGDFSEFNNFIMVDGPIETINSPKLACGFPMGRQEAFCSVIRPTGTHGFHYAGLGYLYPGMSGGPVIDVLGRVVGINSYVSGGIVGLSPLIGVLAAFGIE